MNELVTLPCIEVCIVASLDITKVPHKSILVCVAFQTVLQESLA